MPTDPPEGEGVAPLRDQLDTIDASIAELLAQRLRLAREIGARKAAASAAIFDREREADLLRARRAAARARDIDADTVENVFRQIIIESHRQQRAVIRAKSPAKPKTIAIVGGAGKMGGLFNRVFAGAGHRVLIADVDTPLTPEQAAAQADATMIAVPIAATEAVIARVGPHVPERSLLMDITSLKQGPVQAMLEHSQAEVVGAHPMFGPGVADLRRQVVALCPARGQRWAGWLRESLEREGAEVVQTTPEAHDKMMAIIQALRHFGTIALGAALADLDVDIDQTLRFTSPIYRLELMMIGRLFGQDAALYADIEMRNPHSGRAIAAFERCAHQLGEMVRAGEREAFMGEFHRIAAHFADFKERALEESAYLIARMVERM